MSIFFYCELRKTSIIIHGVRMCVNDKIISQIMARHYEFETGCIIGWNGNFKLLIKRLSAADEDILFSDE